MVSIAAPVMLFISVEGWRLVGLVADAAVGEVTRFDVSTAAYVSLAAAIVFRIWFSFGDTGLDLGRLFPAGLNVLLAGFAFDHLLDFAAEHFPALGSVDPLPVSCLAISVLVLATVRFHRKTDR